jgi:Flp pilus assembly pilin Flp
MFSFGARSQRGVTTVEYLVIVAGVSMVAVLGASKIGLGVSSNLCEAGKTFGASGSCVQASGTASASASTTAVAGGSVGGSAGGSGSGTSSSAPSTGAATAGAAGVGGSTTTPATTPTNSTGSMTFNTATVDQDDLYLSDLSVRLNVGWFPNSWSQVSYPTTMTVDVTWSPALAVDKVITGSDGAWTYTLIEPGKMRLTRTGDFDTSGFQPEPEILLVKPTIQQAVQVSFSAAAPNSPTVTRSASTTSIPY